MLLVLFAVPAGAIGEQSSVEWVSFYDAEHKAPPKIHVLVPPLEDVVVDFNIPGVCVEEGVENGVTYHSLWIPDMMEAGHMGTVGKPALPAISCSIPIPPGSTLTDVEVVDSTFKEITGYYVYPAQKPTPDPGPVPPFEIDEEVYQHDEFWPPEIITLSGPHLYLSPVQFNPVKRTLRVYSYIRVRLSLKGGLQGDVTGDGKTGLEDAIFILQRVSGMRE